MGAISRENAWHISFYRGKFCARLSSSLERSHTGMAAIGMNVTQTLSAIERVNNIGDPGTTLEIACMNR